MVTNQSLELEMQAGDRKNKRDTRIAEGGLSTGLLNPRSFFLGSGEGSGNMDKVWQKNV